MTRRASAQASRNKGGRQVSTRQRHLLALLDALGDNTGKLDFQKLLFLYCKELPPPDLESANLYEFVPYRYGAFSFTCYSDCRHLVDRGLLIDNDQQWMLSGEGKRIAARAQDGSIFAFAGRYHRLRGDALIAETYRRYPYYAICSVIAERVLQQDRITLSRIASIRPEVTRSRLLTIGYEGRTLESYLNALLPAGVTVLCDVRRNAISRKYGFSKTTLTNACDGVGIRYEHLSELGIESRLRQGCKTPEDFKALFGVYKRKLLPRQGNALERICSWLQSGESVALTCYEHEAIQCHRHCVADALCRMLDQEGLYDLPAPSRQIGQPARTRPSERSCPVRHL